MVFNPESPALHVGVRLRAYIQIKVMKKTEFD